jgi:Na+-driven multidrug efflux pump
VILIGFLGQGVWAAAFTSCISMVAGSVITLNMFRGKKMDLYYAKGRIKASVFMRIIANGSSEFFSSISMSIMSIVFNLFLLKYGGTTAVAAFSVIMYVDSITNMLTFGMVDSFQPAVSYCYGAGLYDKVKAIFMRVISGAVILSVLSLLFMYFAGPYVAPMFIKPGDTELLAVSIIGMKLFSFSYLTGWVDMCFSSYFTALERPARSLLTSLFGTLVFPIGALFALTPIFDLNGVWLSAFASCTVSALFTLTLYMTLKSSIKQPSDNL